MITLRDTFETNVMGTVNLLDAVRKGGGMARAVASPDWLDRCSLPLPGPRSLDWLDSGTTPPEAAFRGE